MTKRIESPWFVRSKGGGNKGLRLCCFPYAGGNTQIFNGWQQELGSDVEVVAIELPGRGRRFGEIAISSLDRMSDQLVEEIRHLEDMPLAFFGHSNGALIAFDVARKMQARGMKGPQLLMLSAKKPPHLLSENKMHLLPDDALISELRTYNATPEEVLNTPELMEIFLPVLRADFALSETYHHDNDYRYSGRMLVFGGDSDRNIGKEDLFGWSEYATGDAPVRLFTGGHFFIHSNRRELLRVVRLELAALQWRQSPAGSGVDAGVA